MFKNMVNQNFKIAWRGLAKNKGYSFINIIGLAIGFACSFLISLYILDELSFDKYHNQRDQIYRVVHSWKDDLGKQSPEQVWGDYPVGPALQAEFPEIEKIVQFSGQSSILLKHGEKSFQEDHIFFMDSTAFDLFSWEMLKGNPHTALTEPYSIVLTESTAKRYFGEEDPIGKAIEGGETGGRANPGVYKVTGVMREVPKNSHLDFDALMSMSSFKKSWKEPFEQWGYVDFYTYFKLAKGKSIDDLKAKIPAFLERHKAFTQGKYAINFEALNDLYLHSKAERQPGKTGNMQNLYIFAVIGTFILSIACANFMNLSTSRSMERAKEVGIRKVVGAGKRRLILQFMQESLILVILAAMLALCLIILFLPMTESFAGKTFSLSAILNWKTAVIFILIISSTALIASSYPAFVLSNFNPITVLKGSYRVAPNGATLRRLMVVFQFFLSIALIAGTLIVFEQLKHMQEKDLGFSKDALLVIDYNYDSNITNRTETVKEILMQNPDVLSASATRSVPGSYYPNAGTLIETQDGKMTLKSPSLFQVDDDFFTNMEIKLVAGRGFSRDFPIDSAKSLVINEAAAKEWGYADPKEIVGKRFQQWGREGQVIGVVKDFNYQSLHQNIEPLTFNIDRSSTRYFSLRIKTDHLAQTIANLEKQWTEIAPNRPFSYSFLDDSLSKQYEADFRFQRLFTGFSSLALFIACLGLLGLATYTAQQRTKEIGVRKVLGASTISIVGLLTSDFLKLVLLAITIATPVAWFAMDRWLADFAFHIDIQWWMFAISGSIALILALVTVGWKALSTANANPIHSLREE